MENNKKIKVLRSRKDFENLQKRGRRIHAESWLLINFRTQELGYLRFGLTIPRFVGNAVLRNKLKRWCRESFRHMKDSDLPSLDVNVVMKKKDKDFYTKLTYAEFTRSFKKAIERMVA